MECTAAICHAPMYWDPLRADKEEMDTATVASYLINNNTLISTQQSMSATSSENHIVRAGLGNTACSGDNISGAKALFGGTGSVLADVGRGGGGGNLFAQLGGDVSVGSRRSSCGYAPETVEDVSARCGEGSHELVPEPVPMSVPVPVPE